MPGISLRDRIRNKGVGRRTKIENVTKHIPILKRTWIGHVARQYYGQIIYCSGNWFVKEVSKGPQKDGQMTYKWKETKIAPNCRQQVGCTMLSWYIEIILVLVRQLFHNFLVHLFLLTNDIELVVSISFLFTYFLCFSCKISSKNIKKAFRRLKRG